MSAELQAKVSAGLPGAAGAARKGQGLAGLTTPPLWLSHF